MATPPAIRKGPSIPQFGTICGGLLDGWSFSFLKVVYVGGKQHYELHVTQPNWPFPKIVQFGKGSFHRLNAGLRAKRHAVLPLIEQARQLAYPHTTTKLIEAALAAGKNK